MGNLIDLNYRYQRRERPPKAALRPWVPGPAARRLLERLVAYRYLTRELLEVLVEHQVGRGAGEVRNHLTRLWRYGFVERFFRPTEHGLGSRQYVYAATGEGARLVLGDGEAWEGAKWRVRKLLKRRRDYEHPLAVSLVHVLWDLGQEAAFPSLQATVQYWEDKEGQERGVPKNRFRVTVGGRQVTVDPDSTILTARQGRTDRRFFRPLFLEVERSHKNTDRRVQRFRAYAELCGPQRGVADAVFAKELGKPEFRGQNGQVLYVVPGERERERYRELAAETVGKGSTAPEFWFLALSDLFETRIEGDLRTGRQREVSNLIPPAEFFTREHAVRLDGKRGTIIG